MPTPPTLVIFFAIAYIWAWLIFVPLVIFRGRLAWIAVAALGPTIAALLTHRLTAGDYRAFRFYTTWPRTVGATAAGVALMIVAYVVLPAITTADTRKLHWSILTSLAVYNYSTLLGGPLGEEPGLERIRAAASPDWARTSSKLSGPRTPLDRVAPAALPVSGVDQLAAVDLRALLDRPERHPDLRHQSGSFRHHHADCHACGV